MEDLGREGSLPAGRFGVLMEKMACEEILMHGKVLNSGEDISSGWNKWSLNVSSGEQRTPEFCSARHEDKVVNEAGLWGGSGAGVRLAFIRDVVLGNATRAVEEGSPGGDRGRRPGAGTLLSQSREGAARPIPGAGGP